MKLVGFLMEYNESSRGNLKRCLENLSHYCDEIVVYDDGSTDDSVEVVRKFTGQVIVGGKNDFANETRHRQQLLELALLLDPDYIFWLDADEVLSYKASLGGLRAMCERGCSSASFPEITLWRSESWMRTDYLGNGRFTRLWKNTGMLEIPYAHGLHKQLYPNGLGKVSKTDEVVLHYGYATQEAIERRWRERTRLDVPKQKRRNGIDESNMKLERVPRGWFPLGTLPGFVDPKPTPIRYAEDVMREAGL